MKLMKYVLWGRLESLPVLFFVVQAGLGLSQTVPLPTAEPPVPLGSLKSAVVPEPPDIAVYVADRNAAVALGKALFWDMQVGSDGFQACATCHFHAGADNRSKNATAPALRKVNADYSPAPLSTFTKGAPNYQMTASGFPFHKLSDPNNISSAVVGENNNVTGSAGITKTAFVSLMDGMGFENFTVLTDRVFSVDGVNVRQVTSRNAPSVINAAFNFRNFWDGRAANDFNGVNNWGARDPDAQVVKASAPGTLQLVRISLQNASLASQALVPPVDSVESSAAGRDFRVLGQKIVGDNAIRPLAYQQVDTTDSALGRYSAFPLLGLSTTYSDLVQKAFQPARWSSNVQITLGTDGAVTFSSKPVKGKPKNGVQSYSLMEYNFPLFFGLAIQMYEETLISDDAPIDRYFAGTYALTNQQTRGLQIFSTDIGRCINCHGGPELTNASVRSVQNKRLFRRAGNLLDNGFFNIGLRPATDDAGLGISDPWGVPLSDARRAKLRLYTDPNLTPAYRPAEETPGVDGAFKTPSLRNIELTAPYYHTGSMLTLRSVMDFYNRGGDFQPIGSRDGSIFPLRTLNLSDSDKDAVVALLLLFTDDRVRYERAPFDHPEIYIPNGAVGDQNHVYMDLRGRALDTVLHIPQVGMAGSVASPNFLGQ